VKLPPGFQSLEKHVDAWALTTERARAKKRLESTIEEIRAFYDDVLPLIDPALEHLNKFDLQMMPEEPGRLLSILLSFAEIAPAVEFYGQPEVVDGFDMRRLITSGGPGINWL
jgi:hypothetical protein